MNDDDIELIPDPPEATILVDTTGKVPVVETEAATVHINRCDHLQDFLSRIRQMNQTFELEVNDTPTDLGTERLYKFHIVLTDEVDELLECQGDMLENEPVDLVKLADLLGDVIVFCTSEACKWGIPILPVLHAIMDSQESKLVDGKPLKAPDNSKFIKGPNYQSPEPQIERILCQALQYKNIKPKSQED